MYILTIFFILFLNLLFSSNLHYDMMCCRRNEHDTKSFDDSTLWSGALHVFFFH